MDLAVLLAKLVFMEVGGMGNAKDSERKHDRKHYAEPLETTGQQGSQ